MSRYQYSRPSNQPIRVKARGINECWLWQGSTTEANNGHGQLNVGGVRFLAHRLMYSIFYGSPSAIEEVRHICDNPRCINPFHLEVGSHADNMRDRALRTGVATRKLTANMVAEIRESKESQKSLAEKFGVSAATIHNVLNGKTYNTF